MNKNSILIVLLILIVSLNAFSYQYYKTLNGTEGTGFWDAFYRPSQVFIDSVGKIYVINMPIASHSILKIYNPDLTYNATKGDWGHCWLCTIPPCPEPPKGLCDIKFLTPTDIFVDKNTTIFIVDTSNSMVQKFKIDSTTSTIIGETGGVQYTLSSPHGVAVDDLENVYIADTSNNRVVIFNKNGLVTAIIDKAYKQGDLNYAFKTPKGVFLAPNGRIYITDSGNNRVQIFNKNFTFFDRVGTVGSLLSDPTKTFVDSSGKIYVVDKGNNRVQVYDSNLTQIATIGGTNGNGTDELNHPEGAYVDSRGFVYVADTGNNRVQIFKPISEELLREEATNTINHALNISASASDAIKTAEEKVNYVLYANCISPIDSINSLNLSKFYYQIANTSLGDALLNYNLRNYEDAITNATYAAMNATEAENKANSSIYSSGSYWNTPDQQPGLTFDKLIALNKEIDYLKSLNFAGATINATVNQSTIDGFISSFNGATSNCRNTKYADSSKTASDVSNSIKLVLNPLEREIDFKLRNLLSESESTLIEIKNNITKFNLNINTADTENKIGAAYTYIRNSTYIPAIPLVISISHEVKNFSSLASGNTIVILSTYDSIRDEINSTEKMLSDVAALIAAYKQDVNLTKVDELINEAKLSLSASNFSEANQSIIMAKEEIILLWESANSTILKINNAELAITHANASILQASSTAFLILSPNLNDAKKLFAEALSNLYSNPDGAKELAENATALVEKEVKRLDSLKSSLVLSFALVIVVLMLILIALRYHRPASKEKGEKHGRKRKERDTSYI